MVQPSDRLFILCLNLAFFCAFGRSSIIVVLVLLILYMYTRSWLLIRLVLAFCTAGLFFCDVIFGGTCCMLVKRL